MPRRTFQPSTSPNFITRCHYTQQIFACGHKHFLKNPKITHVYPCKHYTHKAICNNIGGTKEVFPPRNCPRCQSEEESRAQECPQCISHVALGQNIHCLGCSPAMPVTPGFESEGTILGRVREGIRGLKQASALEQERKGYYQTSISDEVMDTINKGTNIFQVGEASKTKPATNKPARAVDDLCGSKSIKLSDADDEQLQKDKEDWLSVPSCQNGQRSFFRRLFSRTANPSFEESSKAEASEKEAEIEEDWEVVNPGEVKAAKDKDQDDDDWVHVKGVKP